MPSDYTLFLRVEAGRAFQSLRGEERRRLEQFFDALQERPGQLGDAYLRDHGGRRVEVKYVGRFRVVYWVDHAVKEVKVLKLEPLTRQ